MSQSFTKGTPIDTDGTLSLNSDIVVPSQSAVVAYVTSQVGTPVTNVTASAPIVSSGGATPNISIPVATTLVNGYLSSTDWTTFNGKVPSTRTLTIDGTAYDLSADRSWTTGTNYAAYTMKANNTAATAAPADFSFKDLGEQALAVTVTWQNTAPSGTTNLRYRWFQIGNMVQYFFFFNYSVAGTNNATIVFALPSDMPTPVIPTGVSGAGAYTYRSTAIVQTGPTIPTTGTATAIWAGGIRRNGTNTGFEFFFANGTFAAARTFYHSSFYFSA